MDLIEHHRLDLQLGRHRVAERVDGGAPERIRRARHLVVRRDREQRLRQVARIGSRAQIRPVLSLSTPMSDGTTFDEVRRHAVERALRHQLGMRVLDLGEHARQRLRLHRLRLVLPRRGELDHRDHVLRHRRPSDAPAPGSPHGSDRAALRRAGTQPRTTPDSPSRSGCGTRAAVRSRCALRGSRATGSGSPCRRA